MKSPKLGAGIEKKTKREGKQAWIPPLVNVIGETVHTFHTPQTPQATHMKMYKTWELGLLWWMALGIRSLGEQRKWAHSQTPPLSDPVSA